MLKELSIKNYALIDDLNMEIGRKFNIITGETGAGKSILLGALGLLLGERADFNVAGDQNKKCIVEGLFVSLSSQVETALSNLEIELEADLIIRREVLPSGRSRAFVNDTPVKLGHLKILGSLLIDIHSQQETSILKQKEYQLKMLDAFCDFNDVFESYSTKFHSWKKLKTELSLLVDQTQKLEDELDYNTFLLDELVEACLDDCVLEDLEQELTQLTNAELIKVTLSKCIEILTGEEFSIQNQLQEAKADLNKVSSFSKEIFGVEERMLAASIELTDLADECSRIAEFSELNPERLQKVQENVNLIHHLTQKHHVNLVEDLIKIRESLFQKVKGAALNKDKLNKTKQACSELEKELTVLAGTIHETRLLTKGVLEKNISEELISLGMPNANIDFSLSKGQLQPTGNTDVKLLFSSNKGMGQKEIDKVASGGELSRFMFVLKYLLAQMTDMPTIIFDEIDTGVSGEIALKMGQMMGAMSAQLQLVAITHLPQVAGLGDRHYFVFKDHSSDRTLSNIKVLSQADRVSEIAKMIGGDRPSISALESASELLNRSN